MTKYSRPDCHNLYLLGTSKYELCECPRGIAMSFISKKLTYIIWGVLVTKKVTHVLTKQNFVL